MRKFAWDFWCYFIAHWTRVSAYITGSTVAAILVVHFALGGGLPAWAVWALLACASYLAGFFVWRDERAKVGQPQQIPLIGIALRDELDKWIEQSRAIDERLAGENGRAHIPEAMAWMENLRSFSKIHLTVSQFDEVNTSRGIDKLADIFSRQINKTDPAQELIWVKNAIGKRMVRLFSVRDKIQ